MVVTSNGNYNEHNYVCVGTWFVKIFMKIMI